jgi:hypothetical protein
MDHAGRAGSADVIVGITSAERSKNADAFLARNIVPMRDDAIKGSAYVDKSMRTASASDTHEQDKSATKRHKPLYGSSS